MTYMVPWDPGNTKDSLPLPSCGEAEERSLWIFSEVSDLLLLRGQGSSSLPFELEGRGSEYVVNTQQNLILFSISKSNHLKWQNNTSLVIDYKEADIQPRLRFLKRCKIFWFNKFISQSLESIPASVWCAW